jgi:hypothetical protein
VCAIDGGAGGDHVNLFARLVLIRLRMSARKVEAAEECAANQDDPAKEERGIERAEQTTLLQGTLLIRSLPFRSNSQWLIAASPPWSHGEAGANIFSMLEADEVALARSELHVIEARGRVSDQSAKIARLKSFGESSLEAEQELGLFEVYLLIVERHRDFLLRQRPDKR